MVLKVDQIQLSGKIGHNIHKEALKIRKIENMKEFTDQGGESEKV